MVFAQPLRAHPPLTLFFFRLIRLTDLFSLRMTPDAETTSPVDETSASTDSTSTETPASDASSGEAAGASLEATDAEVSPPRVTELEALTERLQAENKDLSEQLLRRAAEFQNYRRRTEESRGQAILRGRMEALRPFLDVLDDLRRSLDASRRTAKQELDSAAFASLAEGVELVYRKFEDELTKLGVEAIDPVGEPFDETLHEAMMTQPAPDDDTEPGTVLAELQRGYRMHDRVLRHARVIVAE